MKLLDSYYRVKPLVPRGIQIFVRRAIAARKRRIKKDVWPVYPVAAKKPEGWRGWPDGKKFALVLYHDVDTIQGATNCLKLLELEKQLGFRSCFYFVIEDYPTPDALRKKVSEAGFEVGIHGLRHDGKLFTNPADFYRQAIRINEKLKEWEVTGFTSPSMLRNFAWMAELDIEHGCSTFDTDPFEPQPDGVGAIFPFYATNAGNTKSYVELPYTLPQDHCLFIILKEKDNRIWKEKLEWIAEKGGMAVLNTHPDYMNFGTGPCSLEKYPVSLYTDFLEYIKSRYAGQYFHFLPSELARFWQKAVPLERESARPQAGKRPLSLRLAVDQKDHDARVHHVKVWIDLDNTPHVPFFIPIIGELKKRGFEVVLTARDAFQVCELADKYGLKYTKIGRHYGKNRFMKIAGLLWRSMQLLPFYLRHRPVLALSHGARSQTLLCNAVGIPTIGITDYEHARSIPLARPKWLIVPESLFGYNFWIKSNRLRLYRGIKEDVYVSRFWPDPSLVKKLGLSENDIIITVRPAANEAHYYNPESDKLLEEFMTRVSGISGVRIVLLPRNHQQEEAIRAAHPDWFTEEKTMVPPHAIDGLNLLWISDLVVSGGGTMNREASALRIPVYSIFRGKAGNVDLMLEREGRLVMIHNREEIWTKIRIARRERELTQDHQPQPALKDIIEHIEDIIRIERIGSKRVTGRPPRGGNQRAA